MVPMSELVKVQEGGVMGLRDARWFTQDIHSLVPQVNKYIQDIQNIQEK